MPEATPERPDFWQNKSKDEDLTGRLLNERYVVTRPLDKGGMGAVYVGRDRHLDREVAIKFLRNNDDDNIEELERRFEQEVSVVAQLQDVRIVKAWDHGRTEDGVMFMVTELLKGMSLRNAIKQEGRLSPDRTLRILNEVCCGLADAHAAGIVHRDLKPENLFLQQTRSGNETARILDFGIAKIMANSPVFDENQVLQTKTGVQLGTLVYMAPEQLDNQPTTPATDIYSLGILTFEMLTGQRPVAGNTLVEVLRGLLSQQMATFQSIAPDLSLDPRFERLVYEMLQKDPEQRPSDASAVQHQLQNLMHSSVSSSPRAPIEPFSPPLPPPPSAPPLQTIPDPVSAPLETPRNPILRKIFGIGGLAILAITLGYYSPSIIARPPRPPPEVVIPPNNETKPSASEGEDAPSEPPKPSTTEPKQDEMPRLALKKPSEKVRKTPTPKPPPLKKLPRIRVTMKPMVGIEPSPANTQAKNRMVRAARGCFRKTQGATSVTVTLQGKHAEIVANDPSKKRDHRFEDCLKPRISDIEFEIKTLIGVVFFDIVRQ